MPEKITADMLSEFGPTIQGVFRLLYPNGADPEELKNSKNRMLRGIYDYIARKEGASCQ
jgi:uncharacterized protein YfkK (UPF0435 family)